MWVITLRKGHLCWDTILRTGKERFAECQTQGEWTCCPLRIDCSGQPGMEEYLPTQGRPNHKRAREVLKLLVEMSEKARALALNSSV